MPVEKFQDNESLISTPSAFVSRVQNFIRRSLSLIFYAVLIGVVAKLVWSKYFACFEYEEDQNQAAAVIMPDAVEQWSRWEADFVVNFRSQWDQFLISEHAKIKTDEGQPDFDPLIGQIQWYFEDCGNFTVNKTESFRNPCGVLQGNPISAFKLIYRLVYTVPEIEKLIFEVVREHSKEAFHDLFSKENTTWPSIKDLSEVAWSILRIQHVYHLTSYDLAQGNFSGKLTSLTFDTVHCLEIGLLAKLKGYFDLAVEWLELAVEKVQKSPLTFWHPDQPKEVGWDRKMIQSALVEAKKEHDAKRATRSWYDSSFFNKLLLGPHGKTVQNGTRKKLRETLVEKYRGLAGSEFLDFNYFDLCSGSNHQSEKKRSKLFCWEERQRHPAFYISPLKIEFLARSPDIIQIYEVISDRTISELQAVVKDFLAPSETVVTDIDEDDELEAIQQETDYRTSVVSWIDEDVFPENFIKIPPKIGAITGLQVSAPTAAENLQIAYYTFGGHYEPHTDSFGENATDIVGPLGDRIATFMYYFSDVEAGGKTAFIGAGTFANPVKGSAVFWYNLKSDGTLDRLTQHGACPVILGQKWAANKWIKANDQMFTSHRCPLKRGQRFRIPANGRFLA